MNTIYYIYYLHKGDNVPFYIGKTNNPTTRKNKHKTKYGPFTKLEVLEETTTEFWRELEEFYIGTCQVFVRSALDFPIQSFAKFTTSNAQYLVQSNLEEINIHPTIGLFNKSYISNCVFNMI